ncbi:MAG: hypothetical protein NVS1B11_37030 [Terriglobales bacterium]
MRTTRKTPQAINEQQEILGVPYLQAMGILIVSLLLGVLNVKAGIALLFIAGYGARWATAKDARWLQTYGQAMFFRHRYDHTKRKHFRTEIV